MDKKDFWNEDAILTDLLFESNSSVAEIAKELEWTQSQVYRRIKQLGLSWVRRNNRKLSRGHAALTQLMKQLLPGNEIVNEHHIGEQLMLDVYCPSYRLGAEYHGRQHFFYSSIFHSDAMAFEDSKRRDKRKEQLCKEQGIALVVFRYDDKLTRELVFERLLAAITEAEVVEKPKKSLKGNPYYEKMKQRQRDYKKKIYREYKLKKNGN